MKTIQYILFLVAWFGCTQLLNAQTSTAITSSIGQPMLIDDMHTESFKKAAEIILKKNGSVLNSSSNLSTKQKKSITRIEKCYSKKWQQAQSKFRVLQADLKTAVAAKNEKQIKSTNNKISELAVAMQKLNEKVNNQISNKLTIK